MNAPSKKSPSAAPRPIPPEENAPLYLLDRLEPEEKLAFLQHRSGDPVVATAEREACDIFGEIALSVPQYAPPEACLDLVKRRIHEDSRPAGQKMLAFTRRIPWGWAAAACFAALAARTSWHKSDAEKQLTEIIRQQGVPITSPTAAPNDPQSADPSAHEPTSKFHGELSAKADSNNPKQRLMSFDAENLNTHQLIQDKASMEKMLHRLATLNSERFRSIPGLHRPVIFEMEDPANKNNGQERQVVLGQGKVGDILAEALLKENKTPTTETDTAKKDPETAKKSPFQLGDSKREDEILIQNGLVDLSVFNLPEEMHIRHLSLPVAEAEANGLQSMTDGKSYFDSRSNLIWRPSADGNGYIGTRPPADFDPTTLTPPTPPVAPTPQPSTEPETAPTEAAVAVKTPKAFPIFDESTGQGSIILQDLPQPPAGMMYQLWFTDSQLSEPFSPGIIPPMDDGRGRVFFDLQKPGYAPNGCFLTVEPVGGSAQPTGNVVLQGP